MGVMMSGQKFRLRSENLIPQSTNRTDTFLKMLQVHLISIQ